MNPIEQKHNPANPDCMRNFHKVEHTDGWKHAETPCTCPQPTVGEGTIEGTKDSVCNECFDNDCPTVPCPHIKVVSPTPDVGEEWVGEFNKIFDGKLFERDGSGPIGTSVFRDFIGKLLSQREARVREEGRRAGFNEGMVAVRCLTAEEARQETIAECVACVPKLEDAKTYGESGDRESGHTEGFGECRQKTLQALQSLPPNQKAT